MKTLQIHIEQNDDHVQRMHKIQFCSSFNFVKSLRVITENTLLLI